MRSFSRLQQQPTCQLFITPDGSRIAAICADGKLYVLTADLQQTGVTIPNVNGDEYVEAPVLAFSADSKRIAVKMGQQVVRVHELASGAELATFTFTGERVHCIGFSGTDLLAVGCGIFANNNPLPDGGRVHVLDMKTGQVVVDLE